jgi:hypothetical protein
MFHASEHVSIPILSQELGYGRVSIPGRGKIFLSTIGSRPALGPTQSHIQWELGALSAEVKRPGCEADHSPQCSVEVKSSGAEPPLPPCVFMAWCLFNYAQR